MLTVLSWNLFGLEEKHLDERMEAACMGLLLTGEPPDILLFQELVDRALVAHLRPHLRAVGYSAAIQPASGEYYVGAFVRGPLKLQSAEAHPLPSSDQGRALLELAVAQGERMWRVQTAHLESGPTAGAARKAQLDYALGRLASWQGPALFAGDTNLREHEASAVLREHPVRDCWESMGGPAETRGTWRPPTRRTASRWFRFDRAYVNDQVELEGLRLWDGGPDHTGPAISDHRGLWLTVR